MLNYKALSADIQDRFYNASDSSQMLELTYGALFNHIKTSFDLSTDIPPQPYGASVFIDKQILCSDVSSLDFSKDLISIYSPSKLQQFKVSVQTFLASAGLYISPTGLIGLGTTSPSERLTVANGLVRINAYLESNTSECYDWPFPALSILRNDYDHTYNTMIALGHSGDGNGSGNRVYFTGNSIWSLRLFESDTGGKKTSDTNTHLIIDGPGHLVLKATSSTKNVGIGELAPQEKLHINGNIRIDDSSGNDGFKISYDNTSKTLNFTFVGA